MERPFPILPVPEFNENNLNHSFKVNFMIFFNAASFKLMLSLKFAV